MTDDVHDARAVTVECPTCYAWVGWACQGRNYGYHAAGYHRARLKLARETAVAAGAPIDDRSSRRKRIEHHAQCAKPLDDSHMTCPLKQVKP